MKFLVGFSGFVGSNLMIQTDFEGLFNSKNIKEAYGKNPDILVYSGVPATKFLANENEKKDFNQIEMAIKNIQYINPKKLILISTIDVYSNLIDVNEDSFINKDILQPYGKNRYYLEEWVRKNIKDYIIIRLPALYGINLKKNFIFDLIKVVPSLLRSNKYKELANKSLYIKQSYEKINDDFYKCMIVDKISLNFLKQEFLNLGFTALNFTDSRSCFQFYNLNNLWKHILIGIENNFSTINLATEPVEVNELYKYIFNKDFKNELNKPVLKYNFYTKYAYIFNGRDGYIFSKEYVLEDIKRFVEKNL